MYNIFHDEKRTFQHHIDNAFCRGSAGIAVMKKLRHIRSVKLKYIRIVG